MTTGFVQGIDDVQIGPLRIRSIREPVNKSPVRRNRFIGSFQAIVRAGGKTKRITSTHAVGKLVQNPLKIFQGLVVFQLQVETPSGLIECIGNCRTLWITFDHRR